LHNNKKYFRFNLFYLIQIVATLFLNRCNWVKTKDVGFVYKSFQNETNRVIWDFCFHETNPQNESFINESTKRIHKTNPQNESFKKGLRNESTKWIFWNQYGFANPKPRIRMDLGLFKVRLCTRDSSRFIRICWIRENRLNLLKISQRNKSTKRIFWKH
jgi:hypothetical protein